MSLGEHLRRSRAANPDHLALVAGERRWSYRELDEASDRVAVSLGRLGIEAVAVESVVNWSGGAQSLYFRDPDGNLLELLTPGFWANY